MVHLVKHIHFFKQFKTLQGGGLNLNIGGPWCGEGWGPTLNNIICNINSGIKHACVNLLQGGGLNSHIRQPLVWGRGGPPHTKF